MKLERHNLDAVAVRCPEHVVHREFPTETVVLNLESGTYHGLNPVGGRMLEQLQRSPSVALAAAKLASAFDQPVDVVERDLYELCTRLIDRGLLVVEAAEG